MATTEYEAVPAVAGDAISCPLAAMAIHDLGHEAISLTGVRAVRDRFRLLASPVEQSESSTGSSLRPG